MITVVFESQVDKEQGSLSWEQGLALLLSSSDVEPVQAVFMQDRGSLGQLPLKLGKKLQQLELYEIESYSLRDGSSPVKEAEGTGEGNGLKWDWVVEADSEKIREVLEGQGIVFSI